MTFHAKKQAKINELLQLEIKLKHGRYKGIKNNNDRPDPGTCPLLMLHGSSGGSGERGGGKILGRIRIVVGSDGNYSVLGVSFRRGGL